MAKADDILNWRVLTERVSTSGQPSEAQLAALKSEGVTHVINLGPHHNTGALPDEPGTVAALGMEYIYIPVEFEAPTDADFEAFEAAMARLAGARVHVHCIYNARVSAFFYRLARSWSGMTEAAAFENMDGIWRPGDKWADFVGDKGARGRPNRYAGEDY